MHTHSQWRLLLVIAIGHIAFITGIGRRSMKDETYDVIVKCFRGTFHVPVKERTCLQQSAVRRFHRNRSAWIVIANELFLNDKRVVRESEISEKIKASMKASKGSGARKLKHRLGNQFVGISERGYLVTWRSQGHTTDCTLDSIMHRR
jgi:hypothetical protein